MNDTARPNPALPAKNSPAPTAGARARFAITAGHGWGQMLRLARADLLETMALWRLVWTLSLLDIRLRYRGSVLGPFWLTLSTAVMVAALGFLYSHLFHTDIQTYLPFLSLSLVLWGFISTLTTEGCTCFTVQETTIRAMRMPLSLHAARVVVRNILIFAHNIVVIAGVFLIMGTLPDSMSFLLVPACLLWVVDAFAVCLLLGVLCARYRDVPPIVASVMQIAFFVSPVIWSPAILAHRGIGTLLMRWNPLFDLLDIIRAPLLGTPVSGMIWGAALVYSALLMAGAALVFIRARARIAYWV